MSQKSHRILLLDRARLRRDAIAGLLQDVCQWLNVETAAAPDACNVMGKDLILLQVSHDEREAFGLESTLRVLKELAPTTPVAALRDDDARGCDRSLLEMGFHGVLSSNMDVPLVAAAIEVLCFGGAYLPRETFLETPTRSSSATPRERQVLRLLAQGQPNKQIAYRLGISENTVKAHLRKLMQKRKVTNRTQLLMKVRTELRVPAESW